MLWLSPIPLIGELSGWAWPTATFAVIYSFLETFSVPGAMHWTVYPIGVGGTPVWIISSSHAGPRELHCLRSSQEPGAGKSLQVPHIWSTKSGQMSSCTPVNVTVMCFLTQTTSFLLLFPSPLGERQGRDDGSQRSSALSSPTPSHYFISLSPL